MSGVEGLITVFPRAIAGTIFFFSATKGGDYSRQDDYLKEAIISNIAHWKSCHKYFVLLSLIIKK